MKNLHIILALNILFCINSFAQQDPLISQYRQQMSLFNPAAVNIVGNSSISVIHRRQWSNVPQSPVTTSLTFGFYAGKNMGLGLSVVSDKVFIKKSTFIGVDYSYKLKLGEETSLFFGLKVGGDFYSLNTYNLKTYGYNIDPSLQSVNEFMPNIGTGMYLERGAFYLALGIPRLLSTEGAGDSNKKVSAVRNQPHFYSVIGYDFLIHKKQNIHLKTNIFTRNVSGASTSIDFNTMFSFNDFIDIGGTIRTGGNYAGIVQIQATDKLNLGWTYEVNTKPELSVVGNTIEFSLSYIFK